MTEFYREKNCIVISKKGERKSLKVFDRLRQIVLLNKKRIKSNLLGFLAEWTINPPATDQGEASPKLQLISVQPFSMREVIHCAALLKRKNCSDFCSITKDDKEDCR